MVPRIFKVTGILCIAFVLAVGSLNAQWLEAPAESRSYQQGGTLYEPLMEFVYELESRTELMNVQKVTETLMGRDVVLCILSNPPIFSPADIDKTGKPVVLLVQNVHGSEVAGKDASMELMRDLVFGDLRPLLDKVVVLNVPTINPDGAEVRRRTNEQGFDMNRDYIKLESQEIYSLITKIINIWHPDIHLDSHHGGAVPYTLTFQTNMNPAGDKELMRFGNEEILSRVRAALRAEDYDGFWYSGGRRGADGVATWTPTSVEPRKQHVYSTLANMIGFLYETPGNSYRVINNGTEVVEIPREERYKHQVRGQYIGQRELVKFAAERGDDLKRVIGEAKMRAIELGNNDSDNDQIPIEYERVSKFEEDFWLRKEGGEPGEYELVRGEVHTLFVPTRTTTRPWGYLMPPQLAEVIPVLMDHEITVKQLTEPAEVEVEVYYAQDITHDEYFQGHYLTRVTAVKDTQTVQFPAGSFFVPTGQQKSNFLCYLLEPETNDNLVTWEYLNDFLSIRAPRGGEPREMGELVRVVGARGVRDTTLLVGVRTGVRDTTFFIQARRIAEVTQERPQRPSGQLIPIYRLMKKTNLKGVLVQSPNEYDKNRYIK